MKLVLSLLMFATLTFAKTPLQWTREVETSIESDSSDFSYVRQITDKAANIILYRAVQELRRKNHVAESDQLQDEWENTYHSSLFFNDRNIGDHAPLSQWLAEKYNMLETILGVQACKITHISDLKSLNFGIPITIHPCTFDMGTVTGAKEAEYKRHFAGGPSGDDEYYGTIPVITYWAVNIGLMAAGIPVASSVVASLAERLMDIAAGYLSDRIYEKRCGGNE